MESTEIIQNSPEVSRSEEMIKHTSLRNITVVVVVLMVCAGYLGYSQYKVYLAKKQALLIEELKMTAPKTTKKTPTETYRNTLPPKLPAAFFTGQLSQLGQSYQLDYSKQKQSTVVFTSKESARKNYELYKNLMEKDSWSIVNHFERDIVFSLYAKKNNATLNVTTYQSSLTSTTSQVSVTYLE